MRFKAELILFLTVLLSMSFTTLKGADIGDSGNYTLLKDISYVSDGETDNYRISRCRMDIYYPEDVKNFSTVVWFHGGGLKEGEKYIPEEFKNQGFAVVAVNYRLYPEVKSPEYIYDAAQALSWVFSNIGKYGGDTSKIFVSGHSAGGYLVLMLTLAKEYCASFGLDADRIAKSYPISGQTMTHFTIKEERNMNRDIPYIDEMAPSNNSRKEGAPIWLITGDRDMEMLGRYEENLHLYSILKYLGHPAEIFELDGFDHGDVVAPACLLIRKDIKKIDSGRKSKKE